MKGTSLLTSRKHVFKSFNNSKCQQEALCWTLVQWNPTSKSFIRSHGCLPNTTNMLSQKKTCKTFSLQVLRRILDLQPPGA